MGFPGLLPFHPLRDVIEDFVYIFVYFVSVSFQAHSSQAKATLHILHAAELYRVSSGLPRHNPYPVSCWHHAGDTSC